jgi:hypothetical protein
LAERTEYILRLVRGRIDNADHPAQCVVLRRFCYRRQARWPRLRYSNIVARVRKRGRAERRDVFDDPPRVIVLPGRTFAFRNDVPIDARNALPILAPKEIIMCVLNNPNTLPKGRNARRVNVGPADPRLCDAAKRIEDPFFFTVTRRDVFYARDPGVRFRARTRDSGRDAVGSVPNKPVQPLGRGSPMR